MAELDRYVPMIDVCSFFLGLNITLWVEVLHQNLCVVIC